MKMKNKYLRNRGYLLKKLQYEIFDAIAEYMTDNKLNQTKLAAKLNVTKGYVSQIMNADFDHKLSKLVDLAISIDKVPTIKFEDVSKYGTSFSSNQTKIIYNPNISNQKSDDEPGVSSIYPKTFRLELKQYHSATGRTAGK